MTQTFDVAVVGGGSAGVAAALTAARSGARTLLVERADVLGGNVALALVHTICGLYLPGTTASPVFAHPGLPRQLALALKREGGAGPPEAAGRVHVLPTEPTRLSRLLATCCANAEGLSCRTRTTLVGAELARSDTDETTLLLRGPEGEESVVAGAVVDASGDAMVAAVGGADWQAATECRRQVPSFIFRLGDVDCDALVGFGRLAVTRAVAGAARDGGLPAECESVLVRPALAAGEVFVTLNVPRPGVGDGTELDADCFGALGARARALAGQVAEHLRAERPEFRRARVVAWPRRLGIRETRRHVGHVVVEEQDVLEGRRRDDEVALSTWPVELWHEHRRAALRHPAAASSVPLGALVSRSHPRLGMAGRCISASHEALGALRVIGTALATGEAVGAAAALAVEGGTGLLAVEPKRVRDQITALAGRELP